MLSLRPLQLALEEEEGWRKSGEAPSFIVGSLALTLRVNARTVNSREASCTNLHHIATWASAMNGLVHVMSQQLHGYMTRVMDMSRYNLTPVHHSMPNVMKASCRNLRLTLVRRSSADRQHVFNVRDWCFKPAMKCKWGIT